jgi:hypothetical protein
MYQHWNRLTVPDSRILDGAPSSRQQKEETLGRTGTCGVQRPAAARECKRSCKAELLAKLSLTLALTFKAGRRARGRGIDKKREKERRLRPSL